MVDGAHVPFGALLWFCNACRFVCRTMFMGVKNSWTADLGFTFFGDVSWQFLHFFNETRVTFYFQTFRGNPVLQRRHQTLLGPLPHSASHSCKDDAPVARTCMPVQVFVTTPSATPSYSESKAYARGDMSQSPWRQRLWDGKFTPTCLSQWLTASPRPTWVTDICAKTLFGVFRKTKNFRRDSILRDLLSAPDIVSWGSGISWLNSTLRCVDKSNKSKSSGDGALKLQTFSLTGSTPTLWDPHISDQGSD